MKPHLSLTLLILLYTLYTFGQESRTFSNEVITIDEFNFLPFVKGEVNTSHMLINYASDVKHNLAAENAYKQHFISIEKVFREWPSIQPPKGFAVFFSNFTYVGTPTKPPGLKNSIYGLIELQFCNYIQNEDDKKIPFRQAGAVANIHLNNPAELCGDPLLEDILLCPRKVAEFHGMPVYQTSRQEVTAISKKGIPLFIAVSRKEYLEACIRQANALLAEEKENWAKAESPRESMEEAYQALLKIDPKVAADFKNEMEQALPELEAEPESMTQIMLTSLTLELKKMSVDEKESQAYYSLNGMEIHHNYSGLVPSEYQADAETLVRLNPQLIDPLRPNDLQLMVLQWKVGHRNRDKPRLYNQGSEGFRLPDYHMHQLYNDATIWNQLFQLVVK